MVIPQKANVRPWRLDTTANMPKPHAITSTHEKMRIAGICNKNEATMPPPCIAFLKSKYIGNKYKTGAIANKNDI
tara:strand:+ start:213 stop:437 length:225 start_codon:yes stop_codon:yes gene_type:complete